MKSALSFDTPDGPRFAPQFLGDKWEDVDFFVELNGVDGSTPFFFVQVKATMKTPTAPGERLTISRIRKSKIETLAAYPAPTYVVGVSLAQEQLWITSVNGEHRSSLSSLSTEYPFDEDNRRALWDEVRSYWEPHDTRSLQSSFVDSTWR